MSVFQKFGHFKQIKYFFDFIFRFISIQESRKTDRVVKFSKTNNAEKRELQKKTDALKIEIYGSKKHMDNYSVPRSAAKTSGRSRSCGRSRSGRRAAGVGV